MRSSRGPSRAGSARARVARVAPPAGGLALLDRLAADRFPPTLWVEGPSEALKAAFLAEARATWARLVPEAPLARVMRAAEAGVEAILAAYHGGSLFAPRELVLVLDAEDLARSEKRIAALAAGLRTPAGASCLVLVESAADRPRKSLAPLRAASAARWEAEPPARGELMVWGQRRLARAGLEAEPGVLELVADACEGDALAFFNELEKLVSFSADATRIGRREAGLLLKPVLGADLPEFLGAVALGYPGLAAQRLGRLLAAGVGEGEILFALSNLVGGALGGWARSPDLSAALRRRLPPAGLAAAMDALYRAEAAWKGGRADAIAVLEQATRRVAAGPA